MKLYWTLVRCTLSYSDLKSTKNTYTVCCLSGHEKDFDKMANNLMYSYLYSDSISLWLVVWWRWTGGTGGGGVGVGDHSKCRSPSQDSPVALSPDIGQSSSTQVLPPTKEYTRATTRGWKSVRLADPGRPPLLQDYQRLARKLVSRFYILKLKLAILHSWCNV